MAEILDENTHLREQSREKDVQLATLAARVAELADLIANMTTRNEVLQASNELYAKHLEFLDKRRQLAAAERFLADQHQSQLFEGAAVAVPPRDPQVEQDDAERPPERQDKRKTPKHQRKGRRDVASLPFTKKVVIAPLSPSACETCGGDPELVESRVTHRVGWEPGRYVVVEVQQERCACPRCPKAPVWIAPEPFLLPGAMCDDGLLARVVLDKFGDHLPLNRQVTRMAREGFDVGVNVLSGWVRNGFLAVRPLVRALRAQVASSSTLQGDDSGFPVQDGTDGKLANGRLWVVTDQKQAFYAFSRTKEGEHPAALLASLDVSKIRFLADGGSEYNRVVTELGLERGGCWSHLRRYFFDASVQHDEARVALTAIRDLFLVERDLVDLSPSARLAARTDRSAPIVDGFYDWVKGMSQKERPKSKLGSALGYAISQEPKMRLFLAHGDLPVHNNLSELLLRQPIVGRKNWLFAGTEGGAEAAAGWFSLIASCMMQGLDTGTYLYDVFRRLPDHESKWAHELTPLNWRLAVEAGDFVPFSPGQLA